MGAAPQPAVQPRAMIELSLDELYLLVLPTQDTRHTHQTHGAYTAHPTVNCSSPDEAHQACSQMPVADVLTCCKNSIRVTWLQNPAMGATPQPSCKNLGEETKKPNPKQSSSPDEAHQACSQMPAADTLTCCKQKGHLLTVPCHGRSPPALLQFWREGKKINKIKGTTKKERNEIKRETRGKREKDVPAHLMRPSRQPPTRPLSTGVLCSCTPAHPGSVYGHVSDDWHLDGLLLSPCHRAESQSTQHARRLMLLLRACHAVTARWWQPGSRFQGLGLGFRVQGSGDSEVHSDA